MHLSIINICIFLQANFSGDDVCLRKAKNDGVISHTIVWHAHEGSNDARAERANAYRSSTPTHSRRSAAAPRLLFRVLCCNDGTYMPTPVRRAFNHFLKNHSDRSSLDCETRNDEPLHQAHLSAPRVQR